MLLVALLLPPAAEAVCGTAEAIDALAGRAPPRFDAMVRAPGRLGRGSEVPPPAGRSVYGGNYEFHIETEHFTINWWLDLDYDAAAQAAGEALERAFSAFEAEGWAPPVSSDRYYLWVLLDPGLGGTTGYTTEYVTDDYPDGYPVIYLNPDWSHDPDFWASLAAHELMHAFQYAVRDYDGGGEVETWYWEASATWASELADPTVDGHQYTAEWYASTADRTYSSTENYRQYGLFVFNAWLDREGLGPATMRDIWAISQSMPGVAWDAIIAAATGVPVEELWAGFAGAYANEGLEESSLYADYPTRGPLREQVEGSLPWLGTHAWTVREAGRYRVEGEALLSDGVAQGAVLDLEAGSVLAVTGTGAGTSDYRVRREEPGTDTGGTGDGGGDGGAGSLEEEPRKGSCGCGGGSAGGLLALVGLWAGSWRRRR